MTMIAGPSFESERRGLSILWRLMVLLIAYPLSVGPVCWIWMRLFGSPFQSPAPWDLLHGVYAPLAYLAERWPLVSDFFEWYVKLWGF